LHLVREKEKERKSNLLNLKNVNLNNQQDLPIMALPSINTSVTLAKIGDLKVVWSRPLPSKPSSVTVIKDAAESLFS
jgi:hypothetical protein